jgi:dihydroneopterin aldolase
MPPDIIRVEGLEVDAEIGAYGRERGVRQRLVIDVGLETNIGEAAAKDALEYAQDYDRAAAIARAVAGTEHHALIETVAEMIAQRMLLDFLGVDRVFVRVAKPGAIPEAKAASVEIWRGREAEDR